LNSAAHAPQDPERTLGHIFARRELLIQALTHRSFGSPHNERLEFLGDSLLNCIIAEQLFMRFTGLPEGDLSRLRATLVNQQCLAEMAQSLGLGDVLRLGEGELKSGGFRRPSILADALEAVFAAIYLDAGFASVRAVIAALYAKLLADIDPKAQVKDPKTTLQEHLQAQRMALPKYSVILVHGEAHAQTFQVECEVPELGLRAQGSGASRRAAEQEAAAAMFAQLRHE
jgi:ribonuclease-3